MLFLTMAAATAMVGVLTRAFHSTSNILPFGHLRWFSYVGASVILVIFAGVMSGLTMGLSSLTITDLEVLRATGTDDQRHQAENIIPLLENKHRLLVTLLLWNAIAMEALPIFLDRLCDPIVAVLLSVTFVLAFGEVIPQAVFSRHSLAFSSKLVWLVRLLMILCCPISYPVGMILDYLLGHTEELLGRLQLKALVFIHSLEAGRGGILTDNEVMFIRGAIDLTEKTVEKVITPIESTFSLEGSTMLDKEMIRAILLSGQTQILVYSRTPKNIIGTLLVDTLFTLLSETGRTRIGEVCTQPLRVQADMPLYLLLNEFKKTKSCTAIVTKPREEAAPSSGVEGGEDVAGPSSGVGGEDIGIVTLEDILKELP